MATVYTVSEIARLLGVSVATVRRIADDMAEILPDYQPASGQARKLSQADVLTISALWARLQADTSLTRSTLLAELSAPGSEPLIIPDTLPTPETDTPQNARREPIADRAIQTDIESPQNALAPFLQAHADTQRQIANLSAQLAEIERRDSQPAPASRQEWRFAVATVATFGLLLAGVAVSVLLSSSQAALITSVLSLLVIAAALVWPTLRR
jgi:transcriptional regulator with XRE-family HTH domain